jgi:hypothetical protein
VNEGEDKFLFREHFFNWYDRHLNYPTFFIKYENLFSYKKELIEFLELPPEAIKDFPEQKHRKSTVDDLSPQLLKSLNNMYSKFKLEIEKMSEFEIRLPRRTKGFFEMFSTKKYFLALFEHFGFLVRKLIVKKIK